tara:strand:+ start:31 stop:321 length:291 start_codon:yes stop_codon:yes gene_type:complete
MVSSFVLGVCALMCIGMAINAYVNHITVKSLKQDLDYLQQQNQKLGESLHQRIHREVEDIKLDLKSNTNLTNSKVDKLESKMYNDFDLFRNQRHQY